VGASDDGDGAVVVVEAATGALVGFDVVLLLLPPVHPHVVASLGNKLQSLGGTDPRAANDAIYNIYIKINHPIYHHIQP
jgi:hypothetical protein